MNRANNNNKLVVPLKKVEVITWQKKLKTRIIIYGLNVKMRAGIIIITVPVLPKHRQRKYSTEIPLLLIMN